MNPPEALVRSWLRLLAHAESCNECFAHSMDNDVMVVSSCREGSAALAEFARLRDVIESSGGDLSEANAETAARRGPPLDLSAFDPSD